MPLTSLLAYLYTCYAMPCYAKLCYAMLCYAKLCSTPLGSLFYRVNFYFHRRIIFIRLLLGLLYMNVFLLQCICSSLLYMKFFFVDIYLVLDCSGIVHMLKLVLNPQSSVVYSILTSSKESFHRRETLFQSQHRSRRIEQLHRSYTTLYYTISFTL